VLSHFRELSHFLVAIANSPILALELSHFMILSAILLQCSTIFAMLLNHFVFCYSHLSHFLIMSTIFHCYSELSHFATVIGKFLLRRTQSFPYSIQQFLVNSIILATMLSHF
jgi:hypothetical protein